MGMQASIPEQFAPRAERRKWFMRSDAEELIGWLEDNGSRFVGMEVAQKLEDGNWLLLDEPVSHLDARNNSLVSQLILDEVNRQGAAVIATSVGYAIDIDPVKVLSL